MKGIPLTISLILFGILFTGDIPPVTPRASLQQDLQEGSGTCICRPQSCSDCTAQEMMACGDSCRCSSPCRPRILRSETTASQFYGLWHFDTKLNGRHKVVCTSGENVIVDGNSYSTMDFNVYDTINPDAIIAENSWNLMINGSNLQLSPGRLSWCEEVFGVACPVDVWYSDNIVAGRHWNGGVIGEDSFSFLFDFSRNDETS